MKITHIETYPVRIPLRPERHMITALGRHTESLYLLVRVGTDASIEGVGEATVMPTWSGETVWGSRALIEQMKTRAPSAANDGVIRQLEEIAGTPAASPLANIAGRMIAAVMGMQGSEIAPTATEIDACLKQEAAYTALMTKWSAIKASGRS